MRLTGQKGESGQMLVQVLIAVALTGVLSLVFANIFSLQWRETKALSEKLAESDALKTLQASFVDGTVCPYILNNPVALTFDSTKVSSTPQAMTPTLPIYSSVKSGPPIVTGPIMIQVGQPPSSYATNVVVQSIVLQVDGAPSPLPAPGPGASFRGTWIVNFDSTKLVRALRPLTLATTLTVDTTTPTAAKVTACQGSVVSTTPTVMPYYYFQINQTNKTAKTPADVKTGGIPTIGRWLSYGDLYVVGPAIGPWPEYDGWASALFTMSVEADNPTTVHQRLTFTDDEIYFYLNGALINSANTMGTHNIDVVWNFPKGLNKIEIVNNNSGGLMSAVILIGDFYSNPSLHFVP